MYYEQGAELLDVERFRISPTSLAQGDVLVYKSPRPNSVPSPAGVVEEVVMPTAEWPTCVVRFGNGDEAEWYATGDSPENMEVEGYAIRVPRSELRDMLERGREWAMKDSHFPDVGGTAGADNPGRHPFDVEGLRTNPTELEVGDFLVRAPSGLDAPPFRLDQVSGTDISESPDEYAIRTASGTVTSWERTFSADGEPEVDGVVVRLYDHDLGVMLDYGFQNLPGRNDEIGTSLSTCPQCGSLHGPGEPCLY